MQDFLFLARKALFLVQGLQDMYVQDLMQDLASLPRKYLQDLYISCKVFLLGRYNK